MSILGLEWARIGPGRSRGILQSVEALAVLCILPQWVVHRHQNPSDLTQMQMHQTTTQIWLFLYSVSSLLKG
jgi:hypothetical protein